MTWGPLQIYCRFGVINFKNVFLCHIDYTLILMSLKKELKCIDLWMCRGKGMLDNLACHGSSPKGIMDLSQ